MNKLFTSVGAAHLLGVALLLTAAGCKKDSPAPAPSNTALLTTPTWRTTDVRLTINGVEGVYTPTGSNVTDTKFTTDGKYTATPASGGSASTGTWAFLNNETQLQQTPSGGPATDPYQLATLTSTDLTLSYNYTQAQVQHALNNNNTSPTTTDLTILLLVLSANSFTFPGGSMPVSSSSQITSLTLKGNFKAK